MHVKSALYGSILGLFCLAADAAAVTRVWPGTAPCNATLQACINASAADDRIDVATNAVIDETLSIHTPIALRNRDGYRPRLASGRNIFVDINANFAWWLVLRGFTLEGGAIDVVSRGSGSGWAVIADMRVTTPSTNAMPSINVRRSGTATAPFQYSIARNHVVRRWDAGDGALRPGIQVLDTYLTSSGWLHQNHVTALGEYAAGIAVIMGGDNHNVRLDGNTVLGGKSAGSIHVRRYLAGSSSVELVNNLVMRGPPGAQSPRGISIEATAGNLSLQAFNNTVVGAQSGLSVFVGAAASGTGRIANNLLAGNVGQIAVTQGGSGVISNDHNLLYGDVPSGFVPGPGTITADPRLRHLYANPRLRPDSPAIDAGAATSLVESLDADGLRRVKGARLDIGALEWGDRSFIHQARPDNISGPISAIAHPATDGRPGALVFTTANYSVANVEDSSPVGVHYAAARWTIFDEHSAAPMRVGRAWNVFVPAAGAHAYTQQADAYAGAVMIHAPAGADSIVLATHNRSVGSNYYNPYWLALADFGDSLWALFNVHIEPMYGQGFNIYGQSPSHNAFRVKATGGNTSGRSLILDHPLLNGTPCAAVHVMSVYEDASPQGAFDVYYNLGRWSIYNHSGAMPIGVAFNVLVDPGQIAECTTGT